MDSEDDMHDANDVDSYEEDYYSGDAMYSDDDDDAGYEFLHNDSDDSDDVIVSRQQVDINSILHMYCNNVNII